MGSIVLTIDSGIIEQTGWSAKRKDDFKKNVAEYLAKKSEIDAQKALNELR